MTLRSCNAYFMDFGRLFRKAGSISLLLVSMLLLVGCGGTREKSWHAVGRYLSPDGKKVLAVKHYTYPGPSSDYYEIYLDKQPDSKLLTTVSGTYSWRMQPVTVVW